MTEVSPNGGVKPIEVMAAVYGLTETETISLSSRVRRLRLYSEDLTRAILPVLMSGYRRRSNERSKETSYG